MVFEILLDLLRLKVEVGRGGRQINRLRLRQAVFSAISIPLQLGSGGGTFGAFPPAIPGPACE